MARRRTVKGSPAARDALLARAVAHVSQHGLADASLRSIAQSLGTSHRMLIYHFGSAEAFWTAVISGLRKHEREALQQATARGRFAPLPATWAKLVAPGNLPRMQLFFETYSRALADRPRYAGFLSEVVDHWLDSVGDALGAQFRITPGQARLQARLRLAVLRGLTLDLLTTGDRAGTTAALRWFARRAQLAPRRSARRAVGRRG